MQNYSHINVSTMPIIGDFYSLYSLIVMKTKPDGAFHLEASGMY